MNTEKTKPTLEEVAKILEKEPEILCLGKVWYLQELLALVKTINLLFVEHGEPTWRLPTREELHRSREAKDKKFGEWFTWTGDDANYPTSFDGQPTYWIVNMSQEYRTRDFFYTDSSDCSGAEVEAYLVQDKPKV